MQRRFMMKVGLAVGLSGLSALSIAQAPPPGSAPQLFAVQLRTGASWDAAKPPQDQAHFREHSAHLKRLRDGGQLVMGARFADVGLLVLSAPSAVEAQALVDADPAVRAGVFRAELHPFMVFYPGTLNSSRMNRDLRHVIVHKPGPAWQAGKPPHEQAGIQDHVAHYRQLQAQGKLALGGPFLDDAGGGMMVPEPGVSENELREFAAADPAVRAGLLTVEIRPWMIGMRR